MNHAERAYTMPAEVRARLLADLDDITDLLLHKLRAELPGYAGVPECTLRPGIREHLHRLIDAGGVTPPCTRSGARDLEMIAHSTAVVRAEQGIPVTDVLRGWRIGATELWRHQQRIAAEVGELPVEVDPARSVFDEVDAALEAAIIGYEQGLRRRKCLDATQRARLARGLVLGTTTAADRDLLVSGYRVAPDVPYRAVRAAVESDDEAEQAEKALAAAGAPLTARLDGEVLAILPDDATPATAGPCGIGGPAGLDELARSFAEAGAALATLRTFRRSGAATLDDLDVAVAVATRPELGARLAARYVTPVLATGGSGEDVLGTVDKYLSSGLRVHRTAQTLFVHPNTVRHRIRRFEQATGARLDHMADVVAVWWALRHREVHGVRA